MGSDEISRAPARRSKKRLPGLPGRRFLLRDEKKKEGPLR